jgi:hypothetical protein
MRLLELDHCSDALLAVTLSTNARMGKPSLSVCS